MLLHEQLFLFICICICICISISISTSISTSLFLLISTYIFLIVQSTVQNLQNYRVADISFVSSKLGRLGMLIILQGIYYNL